MGDVVRMMVPEDARVMAAAFSGIGWASKTVELFDRYFREQIAKSRHVLVAWLAGGFAGYVTINWAPTYLPLARAHATRVPPTIAARRGPADGAEAVGRGRVARRVVAAGMTRRLPAGT